VYVTGSDLLHGTPIIDIKPYIHYSDAVQGAQSGYAQAEPQRKQVIWTDAAAAQRDQLMHRRSLNAQTVSELEAVLSLDPRPAYQEDADRSYGLLFAGFNVKFQVGDTFVCITEIMQ
jgi:hypothetical protein